MSDNDAPVTDEETSPASQEDVEADVPKNNLFEKSGAKSIEDVAREVLAGEWGLGVKRRQALSAAGYDPNEVQAAIVTIVNAGT
jgi:CW_7 repeat